MSEYLGQRHTELFFQQNYISFVTGQIENTDSDGLGHAR